MYFGSVYYYVPEIFLYPTRGSLAGLPGIGRCHELLKVAQPRRRSTRLVSARRSEHNPRRCDVTMKEPVGVEQCQGHQDTAQSPTVPSSKFQVSSYWGVRVRGFESGVMNNKEASLRPGRVRGYRYQGSSYRAAQDCWRGKD